MKICPTCKQECSGNFCPYCGANLTYVSEAGGPAANETITIDTTSCTSPEYEPTIILEVPQGSASESGAEEVRLTDINDLISEDSVIEELPDIEDESPAEAGPASDAAGVCPSCGHEISTAFCPYCGINVAEFTAVPHETVQETSEEPADPLTPAPPVPEKKGGKGKIIAIIAAAVVVIAIVAVLIFGGGSSSGSANYSECITPGCDGSTPNDISFCSEHAFTYYPGTAVPDFGRLSGVNSNDEAAEYILEDADVDADVYVYYLDEYSSFPTAYETLLYKHGFTASDREDTLCGTYENADYGIVCSYVDSSSNEGEKILMLGILEK